MLVSIRSLSIISQRDLSWAVSPAAKLVRGNIGDEGLMMQVMKEHKVEAVVHFAGSIVVPDSVSDPLGYYLNNTVNSRSLMHSCRESAV